MLDNVEEYFGMFSQTMEKKYSKIAAEGEARGEARGRAEGEAKGRAEGKVESIIQSLAFRRLPLDTELEQSLRAISDLDRLTELNRIAVTCDSLDEFAAALEE